MSALADTTKQTYLFCIIHFLDLKNLQLENNGNVDNNYLSDLLMEVDAEGTVYDESILLAQSQKNIAVELVDVDLEECPAGAFPSESSYSFEPFVVDTVEMNPREEQIEVGYMKPSSNGNLDQRVNVAISYFLFIPSDQVRPGDNSVKFSELTGNSGIFQSKFETNFNLSSFGLAMESSDTQINAGKIQKLTEKIRRDVKQLGLVCAATDKEKLINVLVINQQLNFIDPPQVEAFEPSVIETRTIKTILKPPTMPQRVKPKRNMNLKISYGVMTAKELVQSVYEREAADRQQDVEREENEIAKHERENEMKEVDEQLRDIRKKLSTLRTENATANKEIAQKKKSKNIEVDDLDLQEAAKSDREFVIKELDDQLHELREKMKHLKSIHVAASKAVALKRKNFEQEKKGRGNQVQPQNPPTEIDESQSDCEPY